MHKNTARGTSALQRVLIKRHVTFGMFPAEKVTITLFVVGVNVECDPVPVSEQLMVPW